MDNKEKKGFMKALTNEADKQRGKRSNLIHHEEMPKEISAEELEDSRGGPEGLSKAIEESLGVPAEMQGDDHDIDVENKYDEMKKIVNEPVKVLPQGLPPGKGGVAGDKVFNLTAQAADTYVIDPKKLKTIKDMREFVMSLNILFHSPNDGMIRFLKKE